MRDKFQNWRQLTSDTSSLTKYFTNKRILDFPGFQQLENDIVLAYRLNRPPSSSRIEELSRITFGIAEADTKFEWLKALDGDENSNDAALKIARNTHFKNEEKYETAEVGDEEAVKILLRLGFDFRDDRRLPLLLTKYFKRQAEAVAKGLKGKMPDLAALRKPLDDKKWADDLIADSERFIKSKKGK